MNTSDFHLSIATPDDRERLLLLHKTVRVETDIPIVGEYAEALSKAGYYETLWHEEFPKQGTTVIKAESGGKLVGFARFGAPCFSEYPEEYPDETLGNYKRDLGELHQLYIDKNFQNLGLGKSLYFAALHNLKESGYRHMFVSMYEDNPRARAFYEKMGARFHFSRIDRATCGDRTFDIKVAAYLHKNIDRVMVAAMGYFPIPSK
jgi:ribosomal protein S18 acetylase RimI-like enzyme